MTPVRSTGTDARFDPLLGFEEWRDLGAKIGLYSKATAWWLGDWMVFGRMKYGRRYKDAIAVTGLDYQTLRNYAMVARRFDAARRRSDLTFQHHAEVCALDPDLQDHWLDLASAQRWSRNELRRAVRASLAAGTVDMTDVVRLTIEPERAARWQEAARHADYVLEAWIVMVLDQAAAGLVAVGDA